VIRRNKQIKLMHNSTQQHIMINIYKQSCVQCMCRK